MTDSLTTNNDNGPAVSGEQPAGDDYQSRFDAMQSKLNDLTSEQEEFAARRAREDHATAVRKPLHAMFAKAGFESSEFRECENACGGLSNFYVDDSGELTTRLDGVPVRARDVIDGEHPGLKGLLRHISSKRSGASELQREIEQSEIRLEQLSKEARRNRSMLQADQANKLHNRIREMREKLAAMTAEQKVAGPVDRNLIFKRNALIREREELGEQYKRHPSSNLLVRHDALCKRIAECERAIESQRSA